MWLIFALITSLLYACYHLCNQLSSLKAEIFIIYRGILVALIATPFMLAYYHTFPWQFYAIVLFQGATISYMDYKYYQAFHKFGAENVNAIRPLNVLITFILWLIIRPSTLSLYFNAPYRALIIIVALMAIVYAGMKYHQQKIGRDSLKFVLPLLVLSSLIDMSNKVITEYSDGLLLPLTFHRVALTGWIIGIINLALNRKYLHNPRELINPKNICRGSFLILLVLSMITINFSMHYTTHPAYTSAITYLSVIWLVIINKYRTFIGKKSAYQPIALKWILFLLIAAITLSLATSL